MPRLVQKNLLSFELNPFFGKDSGTTIRWERWRIILKLAILGEEGVCIDILREAPRDKVSLSPEAINEEDVNNGMAQIEHGWKILKRTAKGYMVEQMSNIEAKKILRF